MWCNQTSIKVVVDRKLRKRPPYCPNEKCKWHFETVAKLEGKFVYYGTRRISYFPYITVRMRCENCKKVFSNSFFTLSYRDRTAPTYEQIFELHHGNHSRRQIAEFLQCSLDTVQRRYRKLASQGLLIQAKKSQGLKIQESIAYDGIENFAFSQFDPNNINHAVGRDSYFVYDFNFSPINRKGRMTPWQKDKKRRLEQEYGAYPRHAIRDATKRILVRLLDRSPEKLIFHSDNHFAYRDAIETLANKQALSHFITPGKVARNFKNRLFAINHLDNLTRQNLAAFKRETISFSKHPISMVDNFSLLMVWKNFMRTVFVKKHKRDPTTNTQSPAMRVGLANKILTFHEFYKVRVTKTQANLSEDWLRFVNRQEPSSRQKIAA